MRGSRSWLEGALGRPGLLALAVFASLPLAGCGTTSSTEVGVRTALVGVIEKRGEAQVYEPGGVYFFLPVINHWTTLPIAQQNLLMNANPAESDRPVPDDITFKTKDGNNVYIDVNVMWRVDPKKVGFLISHVGQSVKEIQERLVRPVARSTIRDIFNEITSEEYYQVTVKNRVAGKTRDELAKTLVEYGVIVDMLQVHEQTVRRWLRIGELAGYEFGGRTGYRVKESDLREFIERHATRTDTA
jgi:excisionase family DNA binding protein